MPLMPMSIALQECATAVIQHAGLFVMLGLAKKAHLCPRDCARAESGFYAGSEARICVVL